MTCVIKPVWPSALIKLDLLARLEKVSVPERLLLVLAHHITQFALLWALMLASLPLINF